MLPSQFQRLTNDSQPLTIDPETALKIGLNESIVLRQLHYWLKSNEQSKKNIYDGKVWTYNSIREWQETNFPFWSESTIKRAFETLYTLDLIEKIKNPKNIWEKARWYTIKYQNYAKLFESIDWVKLTKSTRSDWTTPLGQDDSMYISTTETNTETTNRDKEINKENSEIPPIKKSKTKPQPNDYHNEIMEKIIPVWNEVYNKNLKSSKGFENNYPYWREDYSVEDIVQAIRNSKYDPYWKDILKIEVLFRKKNPKGEPVNYIQGFLDIQVEDEEATIFDFEAEANDPSSALSDENRDKAKEAFKKFKETFERNKLASKNK